LSINHFWGRCWHGNSYGAWWIVSYLTGVGHVSNLIKNLICIWILLIMLTSVFERRIRSFNKLVCHWRYYLRLYTKLFSSQSIIHYLAHLKTSYIVRVDSHFQFEWLVFLFLIQFFDHLVRLCDSSVFRLVVAFCLINDWWIGYWCSMKLEVCDDRCDWRLFCFWMDLEKIFHSTIEILLMCVCLVDFIFMLSCDIKYLSP
jgi:hypothetical protein